MRPLPLVAGLEVVILVGFYPGDYTYGAKRMNSIDPVVWVVPVLLWNSHISHYYLSILNSKKLQKA